MEPVQISGLVNRATVLPRCSQHPIYTQPPPSRQSYTAHRSQGAFCTLLTSRRSIQEHLLQYQLLTRNLKNCPVVKQLTWTHSSAESTGSGSAAMDDCAAGNKSGRNTALTADKQVTGIRKAQMRRDRTVTEGRKQTLVGSGSTVA